MVWHHGRSTCSGCVPSLHPSMMRPTLLTLAALGGLALSTLPGSAAAAALAADTTTLLGPAASGSTTPLVNPASYSDLGDVGSASTDGRYVVFSSDSDGLSAENDDKVSGVYLKDRQTGAIELISRRTGAAGVANDRACDSPSVSADGQRVAFSCSGPLSAADTNENTDVYIRDRAAKTTTLVSAANAGGGNGGNGNSDDAQISGNGNYVVFSSYASNLITGGPAPGYHIFRRLLGGANTIDLVDKPNVAALPNGIAFNPSVDATGNKVAFESQATNLVPAATDTNTYSDVFWRDMSAGTTALVSVVNGNPTTAGNGSSSEAVINSGGTHVAYLSSSSNIGDGDTDASQNVHRRTLSNGTVVLVDRADGAAGVKASGYQYALSIDASGDAITFLSSAANLSPNGPAGVRQAFLRRVGAGTTEQLSRATGAGAGAATDTAGAQIVPNGSLALVVAPGLTPDADPLPNSIFARTLTAMPRTTELVSRPAGTEPFVNSGGTAYLYPAAMSADGRFTVFTTSAAGEGGGGPAGVQQVYRRDAVTGEVVLVSRLDGAGGAPASAAVDTPSISADGNVVAFWTGAANFGTAFGISSSGVYVRNISAGTTVLASRADGPSGNGEVAPSDPSISANGQRVAFVSAASALGVGNSKTSVFVRDLTANSTTKIAAGPVGKAGEPRLDETGKRVVWELEIEETGEGLPEKGLLGGTDHVWWSDVGGGPSGQLDAGATDTFESSIPSISADGSRAAFTTDAKLADNDNNTVNDIYVRDLATGALTLASVTHDGAPAKSGSYESEISGDGSRVAFIADGDGILPGDTNKRADAFVRDLAAGTTVLASRGDGAAGATLDADADSVSVNFTGTCVAFGSTAGSLTPGLVPSTRIWLRVVSGTCPAPLPVKAEKPQEGGGKGGGQVKPAAPVLSKFSATPKTFRTVKFKKKAPGTTFAFSLSAAAKVDIQIARSTKGHLKGKTCKKGAPKKAAKGKPKQKACTLLTPVTTLTANAAAGAGKLAFSGKVGKKRLAKGAYVATAIATAEGGASPPQTVKLTVR